MTSHAGGSKPWQAWTAVLLALILAVLLVLFVLLASDVRSASAETPPRSDRPRLGDQQLRLVRRQ